MGVQAPRGFESYSLRHFSLDFTQFYPSKSVPFYGDDVSLVPALVREHSEPGVMASTALVLARLATGAQFKVAFAISSTATDPLDMVPTRPGKLNGFHR